MPTPVTLRWMVGVCLGDDSVINSQSAHTDFAFVSFFRLYDAMEAGYALAMFLTYFLQFYVPMQIMLPKIRSKVPPKGKNCVEYLFRTFCVLLTCKYETQVYLRSGVSVFLVKHENLPYLYFDISYQKNSLYT